MDRRKKGIILASLFILSVFLMVTLIPQTTPLPGVPALPGSSTYSPAIVAKADPTSEDYPPWWDVNYEYRQEIIFNNTASPLAVVNNPVDVFMTFSSGICHHDSVRVQYWNSTSRSWEPGTSSGIPYQIWNDTSTGDYYDSFTITFYINVSAYNSSYYYVYYDNDYYSSPGFTTEVSVSGTSGDWIINGQYYQAEIDEDYNGGKIYICYNNVSGNIQWSYSDEFHWSPEYDVYALGYKIWEYDSSDHAAVSTTLLENGSLFIMYSTRTNLTGGGWGAPTITAGYANVTYRFFKWGWTTETVTTITYDFTYGGIFKYVGQYIGNSWKFTTSLAQLSKVQYKDGSGINNIDPFTSTYDIGKPYWFTLYDSSSGRAAGIVDLMIPTVSSGPDSWSYVLYCTSNNPEQWQRVWTNLRLKSSDYITEKYAFYIWDAKTGLDPFKNFADGVSAIERQQAPLIITVTGEEYIHYTVNVHVYDYDTNDLASANVTVYDGTTYVDSKLSNSSGWATFYLEPGDYNFNATWNGTTIYEYYRNSTSSTISGHTTINLLFNNITTLLCRTQYDAPDYNPIQNAYVNLYDNITGILVDTIPVNLTGWAEFHVNRSSVFVNYDIRAFYDNNDPLADPLYKQSIDSETSVNFTVTLGPSQIYTYIITNATSSFTINWGTNVYLKIYWRDESGNNLNTSDPLVGGSLNWTLNFINGTKVIGPITLSPSGSAPDVYYLLTVSSSLLLGGYTYQIYINVGADESTDYLPAANQTIVYVEPAAFNVEYTSLPGPYYWKHSDIPLWVYVTNGLTGEPLTTATVTFTTTGGEVSGQLVHIGSGNYTYTIPASVVETNLNAATYGLRFTVSSTNYTTNQTLTQLVVTPAQTDFLFIAGIEGVYGDLLSISVIYRDAVDGTPISNGTISYYLLYQDIFGSLIAPEPGYTNWTGEFNSTLVYPGIHITRLTAYSTNYEGHTEYIYIRVLEIPVEVKSENVLSSTVYENLLISVQLNDTHNSELVLGANVWYNIKRSSDSTPVKFGALNDTGNNGTYYTLITLEPQIIPPGNYYIEITGFKENYTIDEKVIPLVVYGVPAVISATNLFFSSLNSPAVFFFANFGQTENNMPLTIFTFRFSDSGGSTIPNASVYAFGWPVIPVGDGYYVVVVPTFNLPPATYPIVVSASAELYQPQQSIFLLTVKERTVLIPLFNIRVPLTMFLIVFFSVSIPVCLFTGYIYVKRARIPPIIRRIDQLITAINRGEKVEVKLIPRDKVTSRILAEALSIVGVEPRVAGYVPTELMDRLTPLLVESRMAQNEAITLATELKKATPTERERLLQSVGVPGETSAIIIKIIEEEEDKAKVFKKPRKGTHKPEKEEETKKEPETEGSSAQGQVEEKSESTEESKEPEGFDTFFDDSNE